jgi:hypothetical protein
MSPVSLLLPESPPLNALHLRCRSFLECLARRQGALRQSSWAGHDPGGEERGRLTLLRLQMVFRRPGGGRSHALSPPRVQAHLRPLVLERW